MKNALEKMFHLTERQTDVKTELIAGIMTFVAMIYILPVNSSILSSMGMSASGVFVSTAIVTFACCLIMGFLANYPLALSAGMGMNAYLAYTIAGQMGFSWQEAMLLLLVNGIIFFVFTLTPLRRILIEAIPKGLKSAISVGLGGFILFVGLQGAGIISDSATLVTLGDFSHPGTLLASLGILLALGLMVFKNKLVSRLAIPIALLAVALIGVAWSSGLYYTGQEEVAFNSGLPMAPWLENDIQWGLGGFKDVIFFGALSSEAEPFGDICYKVFTNVDSYIAIFTLIFVNLFDTTATLVTTGRDCGFIDQEGKMVNGQKAMIADATGALLCGPFGTSTVTSFAESSVGIAMGARTGLTAIVTGLLFLFAGFAFPIFSVFSYQSVNAVALAAVGCTIMISSLGELTKEDPVTLISGVLMFVTMILTYSLSNGMGIGVLAYIVMRMFQGRFKEIGIPVYCMGAFFLLDFIITSIF